VVCTKRATSTLAHAAHYINSTSPIGEYSGNTRPQTTTDIEYPQAIEEHRPSRRSFQVPGCPRHISLQLCLLLDQIIILLTYQPMRRFYCTFILEKPSMKPLILRERKKNNLQLSGIVSKGKFINITTPEILCTLPPQQENRTKKRRYQFRCSLRSTSNSPPGPPLSNPVSME
jgi:hypothetical protein